MGGTAGVVGHWAVPPPCALPTFPPPAQLHELIYSVDIQTNEGSKEAINTNETTKQLVDTSFRLL